MEAKSVEGMKWTKRRRVIGEENEEENEENRIILYDFVRFHIAWM